MKQALIDKVFGLVLSNEKIMELMKGEEISYTLGVESLAEK